MDEKKLKCDSALPNGNKAEENVPKDCKFAEDLRNQYQDLLKHVEDVVKRSTEMLNHLQVTNDLAKNKLDKITNSISELDVRKKKEFWTLIIVSSLLLLLIVTSIFFPISDVIVTACGLLGVSVTQFFSYKQFMRYYYSEKKRMVIASDNVSLQLKKLSKKAEIFKGDDSEFTKNEYESIQKEEWANNIDFALDVLDSSDIKKEYRKNHNWYITCIVAVFVFTGCLFCLSYNNYKHSFVSESLSQNDSNVLSNNEMESNMENSNIGTFEKGLFRMSPILLLTTFIFVFINQAARSRKKSELLAKDIQEYEYIKILLKAYPTVSSNIDEEWLKNKINTMVDNHLDAQRERLKKEDPSDVPDVISEGLKSSIDNIKDSYNSTINAIKDITLKSNK